MNIAPMQSANVFPELSRTAGQTTGHPTFSELLRGAVGQVNHMQQKADDAARNFAVGETTNIHDTMIALEKADLSMRLMIQVRNKVIDAYQEVMRMQI